MKTKFFYKTKLVKLLPIWFVIQMVCLLLWFATYFIYRSLNIDVGVSVMRHVNVVWAIIYFGLLIIEAIFGNVILEYKVNKAVSIINVNDMGLPSWKRLAVKYKSYANPTNNGICLYIFIGTKYSNGILNRIKNNNYRDVQLIKDNYFKHYALRGYGVSSTNSKYFVIKFMK